MYLRGQRQMTSPDLILIPNPDILLGLLSAEGGHCLSFKAWLAKYLCLLNGFMFAMSFMFGDIHCPNVNDKIHCETICLGRYCALRSPISQDFDQSYQY